MCNKDILSSVFGPCDSCILNFEVYVLVFRPPGVGGWLRLLLVALSGRFCLPFYCFGLAHYRGRVWIIIVSGPL